MKTLAGGRVNSILHSDSSEGLLGMQKSEADLVLFSPPYGKLRDYNGGSCFDMEAVGKAVRHALKANHTCAVVIGDPIENQSHSLESYKLVMLWDALGLKLWAECIFHRHGVPGGWWSSRFRCDHEKILFFVNGGGSPAKFYKSELEVPTKSKGVRYRVRGRKADGSLTDNSGGVVGDSKCRGTVWSIDTSGAEPESVRIFKTHHPATFPDVLAADIIKGFSDIGDLVVDPFCGSGTTLAMAAVLRRRFAGFDISSEYCELASRRLASVTNDLLVIAEAGRGR